MTKPIIGILDYGAGNTESVRHTVSELGYRSRLVDKSEDVQSDAILLIPGVGAFPSAMEALNRLELVEAIHQRAQEGKGILGVCLGMQVLAEASYEHGYIKGLGLIPGEVVPISKPAWHIGWNTLEVLNQEHWLTSSDGNDFYFNHAFEYKGPEGYILAVARIGKPVAAVVKKHNVCGFQFHPEKSQVSGLRLMNAIILELINA